MTRKLCCFIIPIFIFGCSKDNPVSPGAIEQYQSVIEAVRAEVQVSRNLNFISPVKVGSITREKYGEGYNCYPYADNLMITYKQLGFLPDTLKDLEKILIDYYSGFSAAYYTHGTDSITIVENSNVTSARFRGLIAHEFTHALQDQHFNIGSSVFFPYELTSRFNSDFYAARKCMVEGDAEIQELKFQYGITSIATIVDTFKNRDDRFLRDVNRFTFPGYLRMRSYFPYYIGSLYVAKLLQNGGWSAVDSLFHANRILSTAEVLTEERFEPVCFDVSNITKEWFNNSKKIQFADDDNYGAAMIISLLSKYVNTTQCRSAFGWRGDRLIYMRSNDEEWGKMVWSFAFKGANDAIDIMSSIDQLINARKLNGRYATRNVVYSDSLTTFTTGSVKTSLIRSGTYLFWIENVDNATTIASDIISSTLAKRRVSERQIEVAPEVIEIKKAIIDMMILGR